MKWGWIDLISSIPTIDILRWGRLVRIFKILRLLRAFKSTKTIISYLLKTEQKTRSVSRPLSPFSWSFLRRLRFSLLKLRLTHIFGQ